MANLGVKSTTMVQEMVMMLFFFPSLVVTRTTGPDRGGDGEIQYLIKRRFKALVIKKCRDNNRRRNPEPK